MANNRFKYIDIDNLKKLDRNQFMQDRPFPWCSFQKYLLDGAFSRLAVEFPPVTRFEWHENLPRAHRQRSHDRYYLAFENSIYHHEENEYGIIRRSELSVSWQQFLEELQDDEHLEFIRQFLSVDEIQLRFAWHVGVRGSEISPHFDDYRKVGVQLFYFNTSDDWHPDWGGETLLLKGKLVSRSNPDFDDFEEILSAGRPLRDQCLLFRNSKKSWHGVRRLDIPDDAGRRIFNVIFEFPQSYN